MYRKFLKRAIDFVLSFITLIILSPVMFTVAIIVRIKFGSPIIFKQQRPGLNEKIFTIYKFRTMTNECDNYGKLLPDSVRLTQFGKFLRSASIDELPELWNIVKGDMSIVGPRPLLVQYLSLYSDEEKKRHDVRPGLTGLAQIKGRNGLTWEEKFNYDIEYVKKINILLDIKVIVETIIVVFKKKGISQEGQATVEEFRGYNL